MNIRTASPTELANLAARQDSPQEAARLYRLAARRTSIPSRKQWLTARAAQPKGLNQ